MTFTFKNTFYDNDQNTESKKYTGNDNKGKKENYEHYTQELAFKFLMCSFAHFSTTSQHYIEKDLS